MKVSLNPKKKRLSRTTVRSSRGPPSNFRTGSSAERSAHLQLEEALVLQKGMLAARDYAEAVIEAVPPLLVLDENLRVQTANESFCKCFEISSPRTVNQVVYQLGNGQWDIPELRTLLEKVLPQKAFFSNFEMTHKFE